MSFTKIIAALAITVLSATSALAQNTFYANDATFKAITGSQLPALPANTITGNNTGVSSAPLNLTYPQVEAVLNAKFNFITDFAGVADGVTNNYTALQNACNGSGGAKLFIPAGSYAVTVPASTILCTVPANTVIEGAGKGVTILNLTVSDTAFTNIFTLTNAGVVFRNMTINIITTSTVNTTLFGLQTSNIRFENCAFTGNAVEGVRVGGTATNLDTINIIFTSTALTGSPITITYTVGTGNTTAQMAQGLVNAVNANAVLTTAGVTATLDGSFVKINQVDTLIPQASYTTSVTGTATETLTIGPSSQLSLVVISGTEADDFAMLQDDVSGFNYVILKANATTTINKRFSFVGGFYNRNITGALNINSPSGSFDGLLISGVQIGSVGLNNANDLPIALSHVTDARIAENYLVGTYQQNAMHFEEGANNLVIADNVIEMTTSSGLGAGYNGTCMYFVDNTIGGGGAKPVNNVSITGNTCVGETANVSGQGVWAATVSAAHLRWSISGNVFSGFFNGIRADSVNGMSIIGNTLTNYAASGVGINLGAGVTYSVVSQNSIRTYTTGLTTAATLSVIRDNYGYNPVGVTASTTVGASPATICAGSSPETHYYKQSLTNTATVALSGTTVATLVAATVSVPAVIDLGPNECLVVTWTTTAPTYLKSVH
jgi:hypothetical protein